MKIAVICANGKAGKLIVKEAVSRGLDVTRGRCPRGKCYRGEESAEKGSV